MQTLEQARISDFNTLDFTTPDPAVSANCGWVTVLQQSMPRMVSKVSGDPQSIKTENVRALRIERPLPTFRIDGQSFAGVKKGSTLVRTGDRWAIGELPANSRRAGFSGPLKEAFRDRFVLVYGTSGDATENEWSRDKARFDAENFYYRGNGSVEVVSDDEFLKGDFSGRNVTVYGNASTNRAWSQLLAKAPIQVARGSVKVGARTLTGEGLATAFVYPSGNRLVAAIGGAGPLGMRLTDRLPVFGSGTAFPDWMILGPKAADQGTKGILGAGFFGPDWSLSAGDSAWK
jgi:hypothetical protein